MVNLKKKALIILNALLKYVKYSPTYEVIFLLSFGWTHRFAPIYIIMCIRLREVSDLFYLTLRSFQTMAQRLNIRK